MAEHPPYRLPESVSPERYQLEITPDLTHGTFAGQVEILLHVHEAVQTFTLNALNLTIEEAKMVYQGETLIAKVEENPSEEQIRIVWPKVIEPGDQTLAIRYAGRLGSDLRGFYRTQVTGKDGKNIIIASTQCEATDARQIFPGWDEPAFKARFQVTLVVDAGLTALSNAAEIHQEPLPSGKVRVTFAETIPMSTYLVALVVGPYYLSEPRWVGKTPVRIATRAGFESMTQLAEEAAIGALTFFEEYFAIPYPADKLDHVAIPDFAAGAMENLGLVTYREEYLVSDSDKASQMERMNILTVVGHETAHMWFGDLVTMRWWNGIWLNEAFATFMELVAADHLHPDWNVWVTFSHGRAQAMMIDGLASTRSIEFPVGRPVESWAMFDPLTYQKGASILRMLEQYLGPETFRRGITHYLTQHRYANTETHDLWDALEEASQQPVRQVMDSWVFQPGFPLVEARLSEDAKHLSLRQRRFRYLDSGEGQWQIPVRIAVKSRNGQKTTIREILGSDGLELSLADDVLWVMVNQGGWGFYRSLYDQALWSRLTAAVDDLTAIERYQLVDDTWALIQAHEAPLSQAVTLWKRLAQQERDPDVWGAIAGQLDLLHRIAEPHEQPVIAQLVEKLFSGVLDQLGWVPRDNESVEDARLRGLAIRSLGTLGNNQKVLQEARSRWADHWRGKPLPADLVTPVAQVVAHHGDAHDWQTMYEAFENATTPQDETRYLFALARFNEPDLIRKTMDLYQSSKVRIQDGATALGQLLANPRAAQYAWETIESQWDALLEKYPKAMAEHYLYPVVNIVDDALADRTKNWLSHHPIEEVSRFMAQILEFQSVNQRLAHKVRGHLSEERV